MQPIVLKTANVDWETDYASGFMPDYIEKDDLREPLGSFGEDMFARAIEIIHNVEFPKEPARVMHDPISFAKELKPAHTLAKENMYWESFK